MQTRKLKTISAAAVFGGALLLFLLVTGATSASDNRNDNVAADPSISAAVCQVVYPLDETPEDGYRYMFFGNGFFINDQGYVVTAAHLLSYFRYGGEPYILVGPPEGPSRMLEAPIVAADWDHDVAVLRATPNPFQSEKKIAYLPLSVDTLVPGTSVLSASLRPPDAKDAHTSVEPLHDFSRSEVIEYQFYEEKKDAAENELVLFSQDVVPGQSGSPLVAAKTHSAVGIVVGQWLHPAVIPSGSSGGHLTVAPGAALRIHYAIALLTEHHIAWHMASESSASEPAQPPAAPPQPPAGFVPPVPLSVVGTPYPPQAMFGGEVLLDALVDSSGKLADVRVVSGDSPFLEAAMTAVHTWSFVPARKDGRAVDARIGIVFDFPQSLMPKVVSKEHKHAEPLPDSADHAAVPSFTVDPDYPSTTVAEGSVVLLARVDAQGQLTSTSVLRDLPPFTASTEAALHHWQFIPAERDGVKTDSAVIVVATFRRPAL